MDLLRYSFKNNVLVIKIGSTGSVSEKGVWSTKHNSILLRDVSISVKKISATFRYHHQGMKVSVTGKPKKSGNVRSREQSSLSDATRRRRHRRTHR